MNKNKRSFKIPFKFLLLLIWLGGIGIIYYFIMMDSELLIRTGAVTSILILIFPVDYHRVSVSKRDLVMEIFITSLGFLFVYGVLLCEVISPDVMDRRLAVFFVLLLFIFSIFQVRMWRRRYREREWENRD